MGFIFSKSSTTWLGLGPILGGEGGQRKMAVTSLQEWVLRESFCGPEAFVTSHLDHRTPELLAGFRKSGLVSCDLSVLSGLGVTGT